MSRATGDGENQAARAQVRITRYGPGAASRLAGERGRRRRPAAGAGEGGPEAVRALSFGALESDSAPEPASPFRPGDFILTHSKGLTGSLIRFGQTLRYWRPAERPFAHWNHAALVVSPDGELIEAVGRGIVRTPITHYDKTEFYLVQLSDDQADGRDREQVVKFAERWENEQYGFMTIVSIVLSLLVGWKFVFSINGQFICSGLVASGLERTSVIFDGAPTHMTPADLARYFDAKPGPGQNFRSGAPKPNWPPKP